MNIKHGDTLHSKTITTDSGREIGAVVIGIFPESNSLEVFIGKLPTKIWNLSETEKLISKSIIKLNLR